MTADNARRFQRVDAMSFPSIYVSSLGRAVSGPDGWRRLLESPLSPHDCSVIDAQIAEREASARTATDRETEARARGMAMASPDPMMPIFASQFEDARRMEEFRNSPVGRAERQIHLLECILDVLEQREARK